jgi:succinate-semialdehyde dehydrogenase / glutarate-semialdehyde dehydrogenase
VGRKVHTLDGTFLEPTILTGVTQAMAVAREETFGPVAPLFCFERDEDVVAMSNDIEFGLASFFYTRDLARAWKVGEALEYGMVGINTGLISTAEAPFGGIKSFGLGREGTRYGLEEFTEINTSASAESREERQYETHSCPHRGLSSQRGRSFRCRH